jgi:hypothetical protein
MYTYTLALSNMWIIMHHTLSHVAERSALAQFNLNKQVREKLVQCPYLVDKRHAFFSCNDRPSYEISLYKLQEQMYTVTTQKHQQIFYGPNRNSGNN